ncbi:MAG TPA: ABC transporter permease [Anaerolineaceae bacterium]|nr:ABC transporter permease [Anaerolineaceae bacterium]
MKAKTLLGKFETFISRSLPVLIGLVISFVIMLIISDQPFTAFVSFIGGSFFDLYSFGSMLSILSILLISGLGGMVALKAGAINIGGEGQLYLGAMTAAVIAIYLKLPAPDFVVTILAILGGMLAGALWILIPALLKSSLNVNEIVTTLMSDYMAPLLTAYFVNNVIRNPMSGNAETVRIPQTMQLFKLLPPSKLNISIILSILLLICLQIFYLRTKSGLKQQMVGLHPSFAEAMGVRPQKVIFTSLLASGAIFGLSGALVTLGIEYRFLQGFSPGYGSLGLTIALMGGIAPIGILWSSILYSVLLYGATKMQVNADVPFSLVFLLQGIIVLLVTSNKFNISFGRREKNE